MKLLKELTEARYYKQDERLSAEDLLGFSQEDFEEWLTDYDLLSDGNVLTKPQWDQAAKSYHDDQVVNMEGEEYYDWMQELAVELHLR